MQGAFYFLNHSMTNEHARGEHALMIYDSMHAALNLSSLLDQMKDEHGMITLNASWVSELIVEMQINVRAMAEELALIDDNIDDDTCSYKGKYEAARNTLEVYADRIELLSTQKKSLSRRCGSYADMFEKLYRMTADRMSAEEIAEIGDYRQRILQARE